MDRDCHERLNPSIGEKSLSFVGRFLQDTVFAIANDLQKA